MTSLTESASQLLGRSVSGIFVLEHLSDGAEPTPIIVWLEWAGGGVGFRMAPDGWGLTTESAKPEPADMQESGRLILRESQRLRPGPSAIVGLCWIRSSESSRPVGLPLDFESVSEDPGRDDLHR